MTPGRLLGPPWKLWGITVQISNWEGWWHQNCGYTSPILFFGVQTKKSVISDTLGQGPVPFRLVIQCYNRITGSANLNFIMYFNFDKTIFHFLMHRFFRAVLPVLWCAMMVERWALHLILSFPYFIPPRPPPTPPPQPPPPTQTRTARYHHFASIIDNHHSQSGLMWLCLFSKFKCIIMINVNAKTRGCLIYHIYSNVVF